jgi:midasin (ATPase involved in ribosome maturation)
VQALYASAWDMSEQNSMQHNEQHKVQALKEATPAPSGFVNLCGALVRCKPCSINSTRSSATKPDFVATPAMLSAIHSSAIALSSGRCLLLSGPSGCGKSCLVHHLAAATHNDDMLELYMDANTDSRALLGSYMCSQTPGEFFWQPGPLSQVPSPRFVELCCQIIQLLSGAYFKDYLGVYVCTPA